MKRKLRSTVVVKVEYNVEEPSAASDEMDTMPSIPAAEVKTEPFPAVTETSNSAAEVKTEPFPAVTETSSSAAEVKTEPFPAVTETSSSAAEVKTEPSLAVTETSISAAVTETSMVMHTIEKQHACPHCTARFGKKSALKTHMVTHTGEKPHACPYCTCKSKFATKKSFNPVVEKNKRDDEVRLTARHFIFPIPPTPSKATPQKPCRVCTKKHKIRRDVRYHCPFCPSKPALCYPQCFMDYHTKFVYWQ